MSKVWKGIKAVLGKLTDWGIFKGSPTGDILDAGRERGWWDKDGVFHPYDKEKKDELH